MTTLSASPASLAVTSPYDASEGSIYTSYYQPPLEPTPSTKGSPQVFVINPPSSPPLNTQASDNPRASTPCSQPLAPITEHGICSSGLGFTPLNSTLASRVASMSQLVACTADIDLGKNVCDQYERGKRSGPDYTASRRNRAFSAPEGPVNVDLQNKPLRTEQPVADIGPTQTITSDKPTPKPTVQEWMSDIDCVSGVLGAMFADDDRGAR
jgi:hypothetical protein